MSKILIVLLALVAFASAGFLRTTHDYWYTAQKAIVKTKARLSDVAWNYCDLKCLYLERYYPASDFAFLTFSQSIFKANFGACYVIKVDPATNAKTFALWNTVATNSWYETYCGKETEDYYALSLGASPKYKVESIEGEGKGVETDY